MYRSADPFPSISVYMNISKPYDNYILRLVRIDCLILSLECNICVPNRIRMNHVNSGMESHGPTTPIYWVQNYSNMYSTR